MVAIMSVRSLWVALLGASLTLVGCTKKRSPPPEASASAAAAASASAAAASARPIRPIDKPPLVPIGPQLGLVPGKGAPPIMFGATAATIERLMGRPCATKTETLCRYPAHALEFHLDRGVLVKIHAHRRERPAGKTERGVPLQFGILNGGIPADPGAGRPDGVALGMTIPGVAEGMPQPDRVEKVTAANPFGTVERHHYPGVVLEYDRFAGTTQDVPVLGGIVILPDEAGKQMIAREQAKLAQQP